MAAVAAPPGARPPLELRAMQSEERICPCVLKTAGLHPSW